MTAIDQIRNAVEHALINDEISIDTYESLTTALAKGIDGFTIIPFESDIIVFPLDK